MSEKQQEPMEEVTRNEFQEWRNSKVGKAFFNHLERKRMELLEHVAQGRTIAKDATQSTDYVVGRVRELTEIILADVEETPEEKRNKYGH